MMRHHRFLFIYSFLAAILIAGSGRGGEQQSPIPVVTPGASPGAPPSDAVVLFDGKDLSKWRGRRDTPPRWKVENGYAEQNNTGDISTREDHGDCQLHVEWRTPTPPRGRSQGRGNSGIYLMGRYEVQVLDSYENPTYANGSAGAIYGQHDPLVNASRKPGEWQTYDILFRAPRFQDGKMTEPGRITVIHNGVLIQYNSKLTRSPGGPRGPLVIQDHGDRQPMRFRNIWIRHLDLSE